MKKDNRITVPLQTFFVSRELSNCPSIPDVIKSGKKIYDLGITDIEDCSISVKYGKRILIHTQEINIKSIRHHDFIEIIDYDPLKNIILVMGEKYPHIDTLIHWLIHHVRNDVNAIIQLNGKQIVNHFSNKFPTTNKEFPLGSLELSKEVLKTLRTKNQLIIKNRGVLFTGLSIKKVEDMISKHVRNYYED
jgi:hypothetical protein